MTEHRADPIGERYRLRGRVGQGERRYSLGGGRLGVGSLKGNDVVLPVRGVSRHHATITMSEGAILIEDLGSRNGVHVNGTKIQRSLLRAGDEVRIGPVTLRLETVDSVDLDLALSFSALREPEDRVGTDTTASTEISGAPGARWLELLGGVMTWLSSKPHADLGGVLGVVGRLLPVSGIALVEWREGAEPLVLSGWGVVVDEDLEGKARALMGRTASSGGEDFVRAAFDESTPVLSCAIAVGHFEERLGLLLIGDYPGRTESQPLLELLVQMISAFRPREIYRPQPPRRGASPDGLVFPQGYVAGSSLSMMALYTEMLPLVRGELPVLILGETGVGKEPLARTVHLSSKRSQGPFVAVNCAAIPADLLEAELFGIGKGVATGVAERPGRFRMAERGTLFLDEIGDMPLALQAKLLRALEEKEIQPVGSAPVPVDLRIVTATNTDLERTIEQGGFRRDLFYRIAGYTLRVPPLRARQEDIAGLVESFVARSASEADRDVKGVTVKALRALLEHTWPGNVRELQHEVRRLVHRCPPGEAIDSAMLSEHIGTAGEDRPEHATARLPDSLELRPSVRRLEGRLIDEAMARTGGNRTQAARLLGLSRNGLAIKLKNLGRQDD